MSASNGKPPGRPPHRNSKFGPCAANDGTIGAWPRPQLVRMDARFCAALERAFKRGKESAAGVCVRSESNWQKPAGDRKREPIERPLVR
jgi:hypothetical protein